MKIARSIHLGAAALAASLAISGLGLATPAKADIGAGTAARAESRIAGTAETDRAVRATDMSARRRHWRGHRHYGYVRPWRPPYPYAYGYYRPRPYYYRPRPYYYYGPPVISFGFGPRYW